MRRPIFFAALCFAAALPSMAAITGYVMNNDGQPIANAKVETFALETNDAERVRLLSDSPDAKPLTSATADSKGKFTLESPKEPVVFLRVTANGYAPWSYRVERDEDAGALVLNQAEMKTGRVTANGKPVAGARVMWWRSGVSIPVVVTTDAEGRYTVPDPTKWASGLTIVHPEYAIEMDVSGAPRRARQNINQIDVDRALSSGTELKGTVVAEDGKTPVAGATVYVDGWPLAKSGADGTFTIAHAPAKWSSVVARSGNLAGARARNGATPNLTLKLAKTASLSGSLRDMKTQTGVAGAEVAVQLWSAFTDAKGNYSITGILPGSYQIFANRPGYVVAPISISLTANEKAVKPLVATQLARVSGVVLDEGKRPVAAAQVSSQQVSRGDGPGLMMMPMGRTQSSAATAPDGTFVVRPEPDIDIELQAQKKGFPNARGTKLRLASGERKSGIVLTMPSGIAVMGRVIDKNGKPVAGATVAAIESTGGGGGNFIRRVVANAGRQRDDDQLKTANDGTFSIRVKEGTYDFAFKADGYAVKSVRAVQVSGSSPKPIEVTLEPGVEISGRVTRGGVGVEGVRVMVIGEGGPPNNEMTAADGSFRITDLSPGQFMLNAMKQDEFIQQIRPVTAPSDDVNIDIPQGGRISGRVVDKATSQPVTSFNAGVSTPRGGGGMMIMMPPATRQFTSDDGTFVLENVPPGQTQIVVNAPGYTTARLPNINVEDGKEIADVQVQMDRGVRVTGRVTGPDGSALSGVAVRLDPTGGGRMMNFNPNQSQAVTDANGDYTLEALEPGEKTFVFTRGGYLTAQKSATLSSGSDAKIDMQLTTGQRVSGVVVTDAGVPVGDAQVSARSAVDSGFGMRSTRTDANGGFEFEGLAPGRYTFNAGKDGYADGSLRDFDISAGAPPRIVLSSGGVIYGQVTGLSADELQRASVMANSSTGNASAAVDANGSFRIQGAPIGTVRVSANTGGGMGGGKSSPVQSVQVDAGSQVQVNIAFKSDTVISGRVTRNNQPVAGAIVSFNPKDATAQTRASGTTDSNGQYQVNGLDDATYNVSVIDIQRSAPFSASYQVRGSGNFDIDMKGAALRGRVTDSEGAAVSDAVIELREKTESGGMRMSRMAPTDAGGSFVLENVPAGSYSVSASKQGYGTKAVDTVVNDSGGSVEIVIAKNAGVVLTVVDARDNRILNAQVHVTNAQGMTVYDSPFFGGGSADAIKLPLEPGSYSADITAMGYATQRVTIQSPSNPRIGLTPGGTIVVQSKGNALRRARLLGADGKEYSRGRFGGGIFTVDPSPGVTMLNNIAPGTYTLQILGDSNDVSASAPVTVMEGQQATVSI